MDILFIGQAKNFSSEQAADFIKQHSKGAKIIFVEPGEKFAEELNLWEGDYLISFLCPWVIPAPLFKRARNAAIHFHPGPPEYSGIGCTHFCIHDSAKTYGVTCHHIALPVNSGEIISVRRFPVLENETVYSLTQRTNAYLLFSFYEIISGIFSGKTLPKSEEKWERPAFHRFTLEELCKILPEMSTDEILKRIKAVSFSGKPGAYSVELGGNKFFFSGADV